MKKGVHPDIDSYSAFFDNSKLSRTALEEIIKKELVADVYVCGIATDVCVGKLAVARKTVNCRSYFQCFKIRHRHLCYVKQQQKHKMHEREVS